MVSGMKTFLEYVMVVACPRSRSPDAIAHRSTRASPVASRSASTSFRDSGFPARALASARRWAWARSDMVGSNLRPGLPPGKRRDDRGMKVAALAGGVGAGKFLRGLVRA